jgi:CrcB protein
MSAWVILAAILAGGIGAVARYAVTRAVGRRDPDRLPRAVLLVNAVASLIAGVVLGFTHGSDPALAIVLLGGFAGGLSTFSTWTVETVQLVLGGKPARALLNVGLNLAAGAGAVLAGVAAGASVAALLGA